MTQKPFSVVDCDGHLVESISELAEFMDRGMRRAVLHPGRNREGAFPSLDGFHGPRVERGSSEDEARREYVTASEHRKGSGEDYLAFVDKAGLDQAVMFASEGLAVGFIQNSDYAVRICRAYNDYVYDRYARLSDRLRPMALIAMQDPAKARLELRRAVKELGLPGAMVPSTGLSLHVGHEYYWPIYEEAANLDCVLGVHGGSASGVGMDSFTKFGALAGLHHSIPLEIALAGLIGHGVLERFPKLRVGFFEGGCGWVVSLLDRMERREKVIGTDHGRAFTQYLQSGRILIGCEGNDGSLPYLAKRAGIEPFAWASDYPHEVDLEAARRMIQETVDHPELSPREKEAVLGGNARRFFKLPSVRTVEHEGRIASGLQRHS
jgi:predicted TIM-barrel fold metal-dependent hydrolase